MPIKRRKLIAILISKGFQQVDDKLNRDHDWLYFTDPYTGKVYTQIRTKISRGRKYRVLSDDYLSKISRELKFKSKKLFDDYLECTYTHVDHYDYLKQQNLI